MALPSELIDRAKKFKIYRNGDSRYVGKDFVLNRRRIRTWDSFLQQVTQDVKSSDAIRSIRTPVGGSRVHQLEELQDSCNYVAVGIGGFKKLGYTSLTDSWKRQHDSSPRYVEVKPVEHSRIQVSGRIRKIPTDVITIYVYANGKDLESARRVTLTRNMLRHWEPILTSITEKVSLDTGACRRLCSLEGQTVTDPTSLKTGEFYVAVGTEIGGFKKRDYGSHRPVFNSSPKQQRRKLEPIVVPMRRIRKQTGSTAKDTSLSGSTGSSDKSHKFNNRSNNRKPPIPKKKDDDSVFHAKPVKHKRSSEKQREVNYDQDEGGVFKAKGQSRESRGAEEVEDNRDTQVDLPIDQVEAEEVQDEATTGIDEASISSDRELTKRPSSEKRE